MVSKIGGTFSSKIIMVIFMLLKTFADTFTHAVERRDFGDKASHSAMHQA